MIHRLRCSEVWGGIRNEDTDVSSAGITASLVSHAADGGKGGDIYFFSLCGADLLTRILLADVCGHGHSVTTVSQHLFNLLQRKMNHLDGHAVLHELNQTAVKLGLQAMTTAGVAAFYKRNSQLYFATAGHPATLLLTSGSRHWEPLAIKRNDEGTYNLPLGVLSETEYPQECRPLKPGDRLFLYTDGVVEAPSVNRDFFGIEGLIRALDDCRGFSISETKSAVLHAVKRHTSGSLHHDDVTLMAVEVR